MSDKIILVLGAGFSAPAKIPVQNAILNEMVEKRVYSVFDKTFPPTNRKILSAYIEVGLFLLSEYTTCDIGPIFSKYKENRESFLETKSVEKVLNFILNRFQNSGSDLISVYSSEIGSIINDTANKFLLSEHEFIKNLIIIKENIRQELEKNQHEILLEDIFTLFDKSITVRQHGHNYTYPEMENIKNAIMRLFIYFFGKRISEHTYRSTEYDQVIQFVKNNTNVSIITTNWDTLLENYFKKNHIDYDLCLNNSYYFYDDVRKNPRSTRKKVRLIKIHGSINWSKCLNCGVVTINEKKPFMDSYFSDLSIEKCPICKMESRNSSIQLQPEIITPTMLKSINNQLYNNLWKAASDEIASGDRIIFIGYSLPIADFEFRYLLKKNIKDTAKIEAILINSDDPKTICPADARLVSTLAPYRYENLFAPKIVDFSFNGFGDYFRKANKSMK